MNVKLHHIGIGIKNLDATIRNFQEIFGLSPVSYVDLSGSRAALILVDGTLLEFIEPSDFPTNQASESLLRLVVERGGGVHHLAFEVEDIHQVLSKICQLGKELTPEGLVEGKGGKYAWLRENLGDGFMVEICDKGYKIK